MLIDETNEEYHASAPVSKSKLWKLWSKTPFHARYEANKEADHYDIGTAAHYAILEPDTFEQRVLRGPDVRRNTKEWKAFTDMCAHAQAIGLKGEDYDGVIAIRDLAHTIPELDTMRTGNVIVEQSAYATDEEYKVEVKTRPDMFNTDTRIMLDVKNMASASAFSFQKSIGAYGYHMQHAAYVDIWQQATGLEVEAFFFVVFEKSKPPAVQLFELSPSAIAEGHAIYRKALERWAQCSEADEWPGYPGGVQQIGLRRYDYHLTPAPEGEEVQAMGDEAPE
jgi:hypothetical protein